MPLKRRPNDHIGNNENKRPRNIGQSPLTFFKTPLQTPSSSILDEPVINFTGASKEDLSSTLSEDEMSNDLLSASDKTAEEMHSQDAKVLHEIEGSQKSPSSLVFKPVSLLCQVIYEDKPLSDGLTTRGLVKSPTYNASGYASGERSSSLCDLSVTRKSGHLSLSILANEDAESSKKNTQIPFEEGDPSDDDPDDYDQFVGFFEDLELGM
ncbi:MAG: hypothetical protein CMF55_03290 [Legionellales bacterium]|nr:hypothetical protein [Legionellales bacterium]HAG62029.1 hypothetical protein [Coxiellaceae bacterium]|tara:strand:- start:1352 stop:1981 length:630 start_codon:yes stop_codon:yes gene_type:complete